MDSIFHPVSGEKGYFCSEVEKEFIDLVISEITGSHSCSSESGVVNG